MERPPARERRVLGWQLLQPAPVGQPALLQLALPSEHPGPLLSEPRQVGYGLCGQQLLRPRRPLPMQRVPVGHRLRAPRSQSRTADLGVSARTRGSRRAQRAVQAIVRAGLLAAHGTPLHRDCGAELRDSGVQQNHFLIRDGFWLSHNLGHVKLCNYMLDDYLPRELMDALRSPRRPRSTRWRS